jgi:hypothetical protein
LPDVDAPDARDLGEGFHQIASWHAACLEAPAMRWMLICLFVSACGDDTGMPVGAGGSGGHDGSAGMGGSGGSAGAGGNGGTGGMSGSGGTGGMSGSGGGGGSGGQMCGFVGCPQGFV